MMTHHDWRKKKASKKKRTLRSRLESSVDSLMNASSLSDFEGFIYLAQAAEKSTADNDCTDDWIRYWVCRNMMMKQKGASTFPRTFFVSSCVWFTSSIVASHTRRRFQFMWKYIFVGSTSLSRVCVDMKQGKPEEPRMSYWDCSGVKGLNLPSCMKLCSRVEGRKSFCGPGTI